MALSGNITTLTIGDSDLTARRSSLDRYRPASQTSWANEITAATADALADFNAVHGNDPQWCQAIRDDAWEAILVFYTLRVIFEGVRGDDMREEEERWRLRGAKALDNFRYRVDTDESGTLDSSVEEAERRTSEVRLLR